MAAPPIYVHDGECVLCSRAIGYILRYNRTAPFIRFVAIKSVYGRALAESNGVDPDDPHTFIFVEGGKGSVLSAAVFSMSKCAGGPGRFIRVFRPVPRPIRDWVYARIANNRYAWFGKLDRCYLPTSETRHRFALEDDAA